MNIRLEPTLEHPGVRLKSGAIILNPTNPCAASEALRILICGRRDVDVNASNSTTHSQEDHPHANAWN